MLTTGHDSGQIRLILPGPSIIGGPFVCCLLLFLADYRDKACFNTESIHGRFLASNGDNSENVGITVFDPNQPLMLSLYDGLQTANCGHSSEDFDTA